MLVMMAIQSVEMGVILCVMLKTDIHVQEEDGKLLTFVQKHVEME